MATLDMAETGANVLASARHAARVAVAPYAHRVASISIAAPWTHLNRKRNKRRQAVQNGQAGGGRASGEDNAGGLDMERLGTARGALCALSLRALGCAASPARGGRRGHPRTGVTRRRYALRAPLLAKVCASAPVSEETRPARRLRIGGHRASCRREDLRSAAACARTAENEAYGLYAYRRLPRGRIDAQLLAIALARYT